MCSQIRGLAVLALILCWGHIALGQEQADQPPTTKQTRKQAKEQKAADVLAEQQAKEQEAKEQETLAQQAKARQAKWAETLKVEVETTSKSGITMVLIPPSGDALPKAYWLGKHEVTQREWEAVVGENYSKFKARDEAVQGLDTSRFPVEMVLWVHCVQFCNKLSEKEGLKPYYGLSIRKANGEIEIGDLRMGVHARNSDIKILGGNGYHLPTNAEWEHAYRAGTTTPFTFGSAEDDLGDHAWYRANSGNRPHPVGEKKPNPFGLYDMAGNVSEWIEELQERTVEEDGRTVQKTENTVRGGNYLASAGFCKAQAVYPPMPDGYASWPVGFRLARALAQEEQVEPIAVDESQYYRIQFVHSEKALGIVGSKVDEAQVRLVAPDRDTKGQEWRFVKVGDFYKIINRKSGKALNVINGSAEAGAAIIQWDADDNRENQQWSLEKQGDHWVIKARHSGMVLDVEGGAKQPKASIIQSPFREGKNQIVELVPVKKSVP